MTQEPEGHSIHFRGMVYIPIEPKKGKSTIWYIFAALLGIGIVGGLCVGNWYMFVGFVPFSLALNAAKRASSKKEAKEVSISLSCVNDLLMMRLEQASPIQGIYYDQVHKIKIADISSIVTSESGSESGVVRIYTNYLESYCEKDNQPVEAYSTNQTEIGFRVDSDTGIVLRDFFQSHNIPFTTV